MDSKKQEINPLNGELMTPDLEQLKKRRDELNEMVDRIEKVNLKKEINSILLKNPTVQVRLDIFDNVENPNFSSTPYYLKVRDIKIIVD